MPRPKRVAPAGYCYHVLNRGNARQEVFHKPADYAAFLRLFDEAHVRCPMRILAYCLMPNHFHLVLWPQEDGDLSRWMQWLQTTHVRRYHEHFKTCGHVWQGRFKAFPIQEDDHLLTILRYVERNPLRAGLVTAVDGWQWNSLALFAQPQRPNGTATDRSHVVETGSRTSRSRKLTWNCSPSAAASIAAAPLAASAGKRKPLPSLACKAPSALADARASLILGVVLLVATAVVAIYLSNQTFLVS
jgi:REP element-mobilizing transposase RayT